MASSYGSLQWQVEQGWITQAQADAQQAINAKQPTPPPDATQPPPPPGGFPTDTYLTPGGNTAPDFSQIPPAFVNFPEQVGFAQQIGEQNRDIFFENIKGARESALGLVDTDIEGINRGLNAFIPRIREEGGRDTAENIRRAGAIDEFNFARIPRFNEFNVEAQRRNVEGAGLNFTGRFTNLLNNLEARAAGKIPAGLEAQLDRAIRNQGSDLLLSSGISGISGAGDRAIDRLNVQERLQLALDAENRLPGTLIQGQQVLQAPTLFAQPTNVPLNPSDIASRIPLTSNISAGAAQQNLGTQATSLQVIPATQILQTGVQVGEFNETARYEQDILAANATQAAINADKADVIREQQNEQFLAGLEERKQADRANALGGIGGILQGIGSLVGLGKPEEKAAPSGGGGGGITTGPSGGGGGGGVTTGGGGGGGGVIEGPPQTSFEVDSAGNIIPAPPSRVSATEEVIGGPNQGLSRTGGGGVTSGSGRASASDTGVGRSNAIVDSFVDPVVDFVDMVSGTAGDIFSLATKEIDAIFGNDDGVIEIGDTKIGSNDLRNWLSDTGHWFNGINLETGLPNTVNGQKVTGVTTDANTSEVIYKTDKGKYIPESEVTERDQGLIGSFRDMLQPFADAGIDAKTVLGAAKIMQSWDQLAPEQKMKAAADLGIDVALNKGIISAERAQDIKVGAGALTTLLDPNSSNAQRAAAVSTALVEGYTTSFTGSIDAPVSIGGSTVISQSAGADNKPIFQLENGNQVPQSDLIDRTNAMSAIQAFSVLTSKADTATKLTALTSIGVQQGAANNIISNVQAGNLTAALSIFDFTRNFNDRTSIQQAASLIQTTSAINTAISQGGAAPAQEAISGALSYFTGDSAVSAGASAGAEGAGALGAETATEIAPYLQKGVGALSIAYGIYQGVNTIQAVGDLPKSKAVGQSALGGLQAGAAIGAGAGSIIPGVGTGIGAIVGAYYGAQFGALIGLTSGKKNTGQLMRDSWRSGMKEGGIINEDYGATLADGTTYDIGKDGGHKLQNTGVNIDGKTERNTFDVDWSNQVAVDSIPEAHIFALATGLDPTGAKDFDLFHRAVGQSLNAATSNATTAEGVRDNFKSMLKDTDPAEVAMRVETLRVTNKITDQEYGVYLNSLNKIYGTSIEPTDRQEATDFIVNQLSSADPSQLGDSGKDLLELLTSSDRLAEAQTELDGRMSKEQKNLDESKGLMTTPNKDTVARKPGQVGGILPEGFTGEISNLMPRLTPEQSAQLKERFPQMFDMGDMATNGAIPPAVLESLRQASVLT